MRTILLAWHASAPAASAAVAGSPDVVRVSRPLPATVPDAVAAALSGGGVHLVDVPLDASFDEIEARVWLDAIVGAAGSSQPTFELVAVVPPPDEVLTCAYRRAVLDGETRDLDELVRAEGVDRSVREWCRRLDEVPGLRRLPWPADATEDLFGALDLAAGPAPVVTPPAEQLLTDRSTEVLRRMQCHARDSNDRRKMRHFCLTTFAPEHAT